MWNQPSPCKYGSTDAACRSSTGENGFFFPRFDLNLAVNAVILEEIRLQSLEGCRAPYKGAQQQTILIKECIAPQIKRVAFKAGGAIVRSSYESFYAKRGSDLRSGLGLYARPILMNPNIPALNEGQSVRQSCCLMWEGYG